MANIVNLIQGTPEWHEFRSNHYGASEASAMLGISTKTTRNELLKFKATGTAKEFSEWVQKNILDKGHEVESEARSIAESIIGQSLYPVTCEFGTLSASCDGLTIDDSIAWENKQYNIALFNSVSEGILPEEYKPQCQQILLVTGAEKLLFTCSDGTEGKTTSIWIDPDQDWFNKILMGWEQFTKDLDNYKPVEYKELPAGDSIQSLPALRIEVQGQVIDSNLAQYKEAAKSFIDKISTDLITDQDFANAENAVKFCKNSEEKLESAKEHALAQTASIDDLFKTIDYVKEELRSKRLALEKLVKERKELIRNEIIVKNKSLYSDHITALQKSIEPIVLNSTPPNFAEAMKGKKTVESLHNAADTCLASAKIEIETIANLVKSNLKFLNTNGSEYRFLFNDIQSIAFKQFNDFEVLVKSRIYEHQQSEAKRIESERLKIAEQERSKAEKTVSETLAKNKKLVEVIRNPVIKKSNNRPTDSEIIEVLSDHFRVDEMTIIDWLCEIDLEAEQSNALENL